MTSDRRFDDELPGLLDDLYLGSMPAYRDHVLRQAVRSRQRPAWTFPGRWIPMFDIARQPALVPRLPWRAIGVVLLLVALVAALLAALVATGRPNLPQPFGLARSGLVAYSSHGDIYTADNATGTSTAIVTGAQTDLNPRWSRDGMRLAFERKVSGDTGPGFVYVANRDGSHLVRVTPTPLDTIADYDFSPDGKELLVSTEVFGAPRAMIAATDGSAIRTLDVSMPVSLPAWRPPDGSEILFLGGDDPEAGTIYVVRPDGSNLRTLLTPTAGVYHGLLDWSPDGSRISYGEWTDSDCCNTVKTHIMKADGTGNVTLPMPPGAVWQTGGQGWSNDGTRLLVNRGYTGSGEEFRPAIVPIDGSGFGVEFGTPALGANCCSVAEWAPDDLRILATRGDPQGAPLDQVMLDPVGGTVTSVPWSTVSDPTWQRLAP